MPNYRPVSNLSFISKIMERAMLLQLSQHCEDFNLQPYYQSAYRPDYSCETAVLRINVAGDLVVRSHSIKYLGVHLDENLNFKQHIMKKCQAAMFNYFKIRSIRHLLDAHTMAHLCLNLCLSHLDYCNAILYGLPEITINKLQQGPKHVCMLSTKKKQERQHH